MCLGKKTATNKKIRVCRRISASFDHIVKHFHQLVYIVGNFNIIPDIILISACLFGNSRGLANTITGTLGRILIINHLNYSIQ